MKIGLFFLLGMFLFSSCMKEIGNYDYVEINGIAIDSISDRNVTQFDSLKIVPTITQDLNEDESNLEYLWYWFRSDDMYRIDTLSHERDLRYYVGAMPGKYSARLKVTDRHTGMFARKEFQVSIISDNSGLLVLSNLNGKANLTIVNGAEDCFQDIYFTANGEYAGENPVAIANVDIFQKKGMHDVVIMCDDPRGGVVVDPVALVRQSDFSELFYTAPRRIHPEAYSSSFNDEIMVDYDFIINDGKLYNRDFYNISATNYGLSFRPEIYGNYKLSPYTFVKSSSLLFYDNANYCFQMLACGGGKISTTQFSPVPLIDEVNVDTLVFNPRDVKLELVYGGEGWKKEGALAGFGYGIFRKPGTSDIGNMYCLKFSIGTKMSFGPVYGDCFTPYFKKPATGAPELECATAYAISKLDPYLYYACRNKIYSYDLEYNRAKVIYDTDTVVGAGANVDYLYFRQGSYTKYSQKIWVATSQAGQSGKTGAIHVLNLGRNGDVVAVDTVYKNVCGRVVDMTYKSR